MRKVMITSEERLQLHRKMDAVQLQGVWTNFPQEGVAVATGRLQYAAGLLQQLLQQRAEQMRRRKERGPVPKEVRKQLLDEVIERIVRDDADDLLTVLAL